MDEPRPKRFVWAITLSVYAAIRVGIQALVRLAELKPLIALATPRFTGLRPPEVNAPEIFRYAGPSRNKIGTAHKRNPPPSLVRWDPMVNKSLIGRAYRDEEFVPLNSGMPFWLPRQPPATTVGCR